MCRGRAAGACTRRGPKAHGRGHPPAGVHEVDAAEEAPLVAPPVVGQPARAELVEEELAVETISGRRVPGQAAAQQGVVERPQVALDGAVEHDRVEVSHLEALARPARRVVGEHHHLEDLGLHVSRQVDGQLVERRVAARVQLRLARDALDGADAARVAVGVAEPPEPGSDLDMVLRCGIVGQLQRALAEAEVGAVAPRADLEVLRRYAQHAGRFEIVVHVVVADELGEAKAGCRELLPLDPGGAGLVLSHPRLDEDRPDVSCRSQPARGTVRGDPRLLRRRLRPGGQAEVGVQEG